MKLQLDAINLMLQDLGMVDDGLRHRAAFHGCSRELADLREELRDYLTQRKRGVKTTPLE
jgi:plasmid stability protein